MVFIIFRSVTVKIRGSNGAYQAIGGPYDIPTSAALADDMYFVSLVHKTYNGNFIFTGRFFHNLNNLSSSCLENNPNLVVSPGLK